jgi:pyruvyltransferase
MKCFWYKENLKANRAMNFGDQLSPVVLDYVLGKRFKFAARDDHGKLLAIGSIMAALRPGDVVWGSGAIKNRPLQVYPGNKFLAVRGPMTGALLKLAGGEDPEVYGDPGLLLPLIYQPKGPKTGEIGVLPHYVDKNAKIPLKTGVHYRMIDITAPWPEVIDNICACSMIRTSALHGVIAAEAYGIPVIWEQYSDKIIGGEFKFQDYFLGTGRLKQRPGHFTEPLRYLQARQNKLIEVLKKYYAKD